MTLLVLSGCMLGRPSAGEHLFTLESAPAFLAEELAVATAREAFTLDGAKIDEWQLIRMEPSGSKAPDGERDNYLVRFLDSPNFGRVSFVKGKEYRTYSVQLKERQVICRRFFGL